jgi:hypothetical protein
MCGGRAHKSKTGNEKDKNFVANKLPKTVYRTSALTFVRFDKLKNTELTIATSSMFRLSRIQILALLARILDEGEKVQRENRQVCGTLVLNRKAYPSDHVVIVTWCGKCIKPREAECKQHICEVVRPTLFHSLLSLILLCTFSYANNRAVLDIAMSFGFSVGDFVAAIGLANKIRKEFADAPSQFKALSDECVI